ncbi:unnamed protein product [Schistosoma mattheei]|uniref:Uncharacterized protein n=1 Tax=Schistosoma mattheei TaxID=31246 RepID=A0A3P8G4M7_9TREM|nr:unnamed protein product [Schistosoma mattheei]
MKLKFNLFTGKCYFSKKILNKLYYCRLFFIFFLQFQFINVCIFNCLIKMIQ